MDDLENGLTAGYEVSRRENVSIPALSEPGSTWNVEGEDPEGCKEETWNKAHSLSSEGTR